MTVPRDFYHASTDDPSLKASDHLNALMDVKEIHEDITIVDKKLEEKVSRAEVTSREMEATASLVSPTATADDVRTGAQLIKPESLRETMRLLVITRNVAARQLGSTSQKRLIELSKIFAEIHVVILNEFTEQTVSTVRLTDNVWLYSTDSAKWWKMGFDAYRIANEQLIFAGAFRADMVVAEDPFEAGVVGSIIAEKYERPFQVHVLEDIYSEEFHDRDQHSFWRSFLPSYVLGRADCVRTATSGVCEKLIHKYPDLVLHTEVLPIYYNLHVWRDTVPLFSLKDRYPHFAFVMLHVSHMHAPSHTMEVIQGVAPLLRTYPTLGLVIVGNGPYRPALEKLVITLGIQRQVEFEPVPDEIISHMKSAHLLIHISEDPIEDITVLQAAAVKLPMIASAHNIAGVLFEDNESAFLCPGADPSCVSSKLKSFLSDNQIRTQFGYQAEAIVFERIEQDYDAYLRAYRSSIERCAVSRTQVA